MNRALPIFNLLGCLLLGWLAVLQWKNEHQLIGQNRNLAAQLTAVIRDRDEQTHRFTTLENDANLLKESVAALQQSLEKSADTSEQQASLAKESEERLAQTLTQLHQWEQSVQERDSRITALDAALRQTRARLDEAIAALHKAQRSPTENPP